MSVKLKVRSVSCSFPLSSSTTQPSGRKVCLFVQVSCLGTTVWTGGVIQNCTGAKGSKIISSSWGKFPPSHFPWTQRLILLLSALTWMQLLEAWSCHGMYNIMVFPHLPTQLFMLHNPCPPAKSISPTNTVVEPATSVLLAPNLIERTLRLEPQSKQDLVEETCSLASFLIQLSKNKARECLGYIYDPYFSLPGTFRLITLIHLFLQRLIKEIGNYDTFPITVDMEENRTLTKSKCHVYPPGIHGPSGSLQNS